MAIQKWKLLKRSIKLVILRFELYISDIILIELLYISIEAEPGVTIINKFQCFVLTKVANKNMIVVILENSYMKITNK